jgi:hypothetical protein
MDAWRKVFYLRDLCKSRQMQGLRLQEPVQQLCFF